METEKLFLAADSGGSKTLWVLINENGDTVAKSRTNGLGALKEGILPIEQTITEAFKELSPHGIPEGIFLSLGGPNVAEVQGAIENVWTDVPVKVEREACGDAILKAASYMGCRAVVMCGTGSVAVGDTSSGRKYAGGWGPVYGDGGSGGGLGQEALKIFLRSIDKMSDAGRLSELFRDLTEGIDISSFAGRMELKSRAVNMSRRELAALAPDIYRLSEQGDKVSKTLYEKAAEEIAAMAFAVSDDSDDFSVLLCGGFFANKSMLFKACREIFAKSSKAKLIYEPLFSPVVAAQMAILNSNGIVITKNIFEKILDNNWRSKS